MLRKLRVIASKQEKNMNTELIADIIEHFSNENAGEEIKYVCNDRCGDYLDLMLSNIRVVGQILEYELLKLCEVIHGIGHDVYSHDKEKTDITELCDSILVNANEVDRHLKAIRIYAEAKMYLEAQYCGTIEGLNSEISEN